MNPQRRDRSGFTVVEALIALTIGLIALGIALAITGAGQRCVRGSDARMEARRGAFLAIEAIRRELEEARDIRVDPRNMSVTWFKDPGSGPGHLLADPGTGQLRIQVPGAPREKVLPIPGLDSFEARPGAGGFLEIQIKISPASASGRPGAAGKIVYSHRLRTATPPATDPSTWNPVP